MNYYFAKEIKLDILPFWKEILKSLYLIISMFFIGYILIYLIRPDSIIKLCIDILIFTTLFIITAYYLYMNTYEKQLLSSILKRIKI